MNDLYVILLAMPLIIIVGGLILGAMALHHHARLKELAYQERIAMIERGMVPPPEVDPGRFERSMTRAGSVSDAGLAESGRAARYRSGGILVVATGFGFLLLVSFAAGAPGAGVGVGGAVIVVGLALLLNAYLSRHDRPLPVPPPREPPPPQSEG